MWTRVKYQRGPLRDYGKTFKLLEVQEYAIDQVANGFVFGFDWLKSWRDFCRPIIERIGVKINKVPVCFSIANFYKDNKNLLIHPPGLLWV